MKRYNPYTNDELIEALKKYSNKRKVKYVVSGSFFQWSGISQSTIQRHFETLYNFCKTSVLSP